MDSEAEPVRDEEARREPTDRMPELPVVAIPPDEGAPAPEVARSTEMPVPSEPVRAAASGLGLHAPRAWLARFLRERGEDSLNLVTLGLLAVGVFLLKVEPIGIGGDAIRKWLFVRQWFHANDFATAKWDHHMARFGVNGIAYLVQRVFGPLGRSYYIAPVSAGVIQVLFVYLSGKRLGGRLVGVVGALLLVVFPPMHTAASQLLPEVFQGAYTIIAMYLFLRYADAEEAKRTRWLVGAALVIFVDYLAKETSVFFIPGFLAAVWMVSPRHRWRDVAVLLGVFALGVACETAFYRGFTHYAHRFAVVEEVHVPEAKDADVADFLGLLTRYEHAVPAWRFLFYTFSASSLGVLAFARNVRATALVAVGTSYLFLLTFLVRGLHPVVVWQAFRSRYVDPAAPFVILVTALFLVLVFRELAARVVLSRKVAWLVASLSRFGPAATFVASALLGFLHYRSVKDKLSDNPLVTVPAMRAIVADTYRRNLPVVSARNDEGLHAAFATMLDDRLLVKQGLLPEFKGAKQHGAGKTYIVRYPSVYTNSEVLSRLLRVHCYTEVVGRDGAFFVRRMNLLPPACDVELSEPTAPPGSVGG